MRQITIIPLESLGGRDNQMATIQSHGEPLEQLVASNLELTLGRNATKARNWCQLIIQEKGSHFEHY